MAELRQNPIDFPWALVLEAQRMKNQNQRAMFGDIAGIGQGLGTIGQTVEQEKAKSTVAQALEAMRTNKIPTAGINGFGVPPQYQQTATAGVDETMMNMPQQPQNQSPAMPPGLMKALLTLDPNIGTKMVTDQMNPQSQWKIVPNMLSKNGKPVQENARTGQIREAPFDVTPTGRGNAAFGVGSTTWANATPEERNIAQALYEGRMKPMDLGYRDRSIGVKLAEQYARQNGLPPYKSYAGAVAGKTAEGFAAGKLGQNALSLNTALGHVDSAFDAYNGIENTDQAWLNKPLNALRKQTNDPNVVKLNVTLNALRGELGTVFKGSAGTDQDAKHWMDYLSEDLTPTQFNAVIPQIDELLRSRLSALDYQRQSGMSGRGEMPLLSPKGASISSRLGKGKSGKVVEDGWVYTPGIGGKGNKANWKKQ